MKILVVREGFFGNLKNKTKQFSSKIKDKLTLSKKLYSMYISKLSENLRNSLEKENIDKDKINSFMNKFTFYFNGSKIKNKYLAIADKEIKRKEEIFIIDDLIVGITLGLVTGIKVLVLESIKAFIITALVGTTGFLSFKKLIEIISKSNETTENEVKMELKDKNSKTYRALLN